MIETIRDRLDRVGAWETMKRLASGYGVAIERVLDGDRKPLPTACRHHMWRLLAGTLGLSEAEIGRVWGVHHTTVHMAIRKWERGEARP